MTRNYRRLRTNSNRYERVLVERFDAVRKFAEMEAAWRLQRHRMIRRGADGRAETGLARCWAARNGERCGGRRLAGCPAHSERFEAVKCRFGRIEPVLRGGGEASLEAFKPRGATRAG